MSATEPEQFIHRSAELAPRALCSGRPAGKAVADIPGEVNSPTDTISLGNTPSTWFSGNVAAAFVDAVDAEVIATVSVAAVGLTPSTYPHRRHWRGELD